MAAILSRPQYDNTACHSGGHWWDYYTGIIYSSHCNLFESHHSSDVIMDTIASQITSLTIVYSTVYSDADQRKHQSSASLAFVRRIHRGPVNSPHKWPVKRKMFPFDDVIRFANLVIGRRWYTHYITQYQPHQVDFTEGSTAERCQVRLMVVAKAPRAAAFDGNSYNDVDKNTRYNWSRVISAPAPLTSRGD